LGNTRVVGISAEELALLGAAGLDGAAILASGTRAPAKFWGLDDLGEIGLGKAGCVLVLDRDPLANPSVLATPAQVWINGVLQR
jgi:imidazolonepropionase-like amidohydrolase